MKQKKSEIIKFVVCKHKQNKNTLMGKVNKNRDKPREIYKLANWSEYNNSLKNRGKLTIWLSDDVKES